MLRKGMYAAKVDFWHAYFHIPHSSSFAYYVGVEVDGSCYRFRGLPFGLNASPLIFCSFMRVLSRLWRECGLLVFVYMDDIVILRSTYAACRASVAVVRSMLEEAGFLVNYEKSTFEPSKVVEFLGLEADFERGVVSIPERKRKSFRKDLGKLVTRAQVSLRAACSILGNVRSLLVCFPGLKIVTDHLMAFTQLAHKFGYDCSLPVPTIVREQALLCKDFLSSGAGRAMLGIGPSVCVATDASDLELGAIYLSNHRRTVHAYTHPALHINIKDIRASTLGV